MNGTPADLTETPNRGEERNVDALSDVLRVAHLTGGVFVHTEFFEPWCMVAQLTPQYCARFLGPTSHLIHYHYVVEGRLCIQVEGEEPFELSSGEVVMFPRNDVHLLGSQLDLPPVVASDVIVPSANGGISAIRLGGEGARTRLICGFLGCDGVEGNLLISTLPRVLRLDVEAGSAADWIRSTFQYAADEVANGRPGSETVLAKLSEMLFVQAVRRYAEALPEGVTGWLAGLRDPHVAQALVLLHRDVARSWTVDELGREVGLSRSALGERFTRLIGVAPMQYRANWRMQVAAQTLRSGDASLNEIATAIGYESEAAFSRAFKKAFRTAPATWRRLHKLGGEVREHAVLQGSKADHRKPGVR
jgi:AraC-like DNA-binding protein/mannose-6-phosphate isomerase-like protein (cupin superfamily)